jgi:hypothetical protein
MPPPTPVDERLAGLMISVFFKKPESPQAAEKEDAYRKVDRFFGGRFRPGLQVVGPLVERSEFQSIGAFVFFGHGRVIRASLCDFIFQGFRKRISSSLCI